LSSSDGSGLDAAIRERDGAVDVVRVIANVANQQRDALRKQSRGV
jgi:hypothetical protein